MCVTSICKRCKSVQNITSQLALKFITICLLHTKSYALLLLHFSKKLVSFEFESKCVLTSVCRNSEMDKVCMNNTKINIPEMSAQKQFP